MRRQFESARGLMIVSDALPRSFIGKVLRRALIDDDHQKNA